MNTRITSGDIVKAMERASDAKALCKDAEKAIEDHYDEKVTLKSLIGHERDAAIDAYIADGERLSVAYNDANARMIDAERGAQLLGYAQTKQAMYIVIDALFSAMDDIEGKRADYKRTHALIWRALERAGLSVERSERTSARARVGAYWVYISTPSCYGCATIGLYNSDYSYRDEFETSVDISDYSDRLVISRDAIERAAGRLGLWAYITPDECIDRAACYALDVEKAEQIKEHARAELEVLKSDYAMWGLDTDAFYLPR